MKSSPVQVTLVDRRNFHLFHPLLYQAAWSHLVIGRASKAAGAGKKEIDKARELIRKAQWYWDFVAAENSMGFHNPTLALNTLGQSIDLAYRAVSTAEKASSRRKR